jgi:hypothetical protein
VGSYSQSIKIEWSGNYKQKSLCYVFAWGYVNLRVQRSRWLSSDETCNHDEQYLMKLRQRICARWEQLDIKQRSSILWLWSLPGFQTSYIDRLWWDTCKKWAMTNVIRYLRVFFVTSVYICEYIYMDGTKCMRACPMYIYPVCYDEHLGRGKLLIFTTFSILVFLYFWICIHSIIS